MRPLLVSLCLLSTAFTPALAASLGTCVLVKKNQNGSFSKSFSPGMSRAECEELSVEDYAEVKWADIEELGEVQEGSAFCSSMACSYPCINHSICTCAPGYCY